MVCKTRSLHGAYPSLHPSRESTSVPEQLNINVVTGACSWLMVAVSSCVQATLSEASCGICHRNKVHSIAWLYRGPLPKIVDDGIIKMWCMKVQRVMYEGTIKLWCMTVQRVMDRVQMWSTKILSVCDEHKAEIFKNKNWNCKIVSQKV